MILQAGVLDSYCGHYRLEPLVIRTSLVISQLVLLVTALVDSLDHFLVMRLCLQLDFPLLVVLLQLQLLPLKLCDFKLHLIMLFPIALKLVVNLGVIINCDEVLNSDALLFDQCGSLNFFQ